MDERMSWEKHVESICSKVSAGIGAMMRLKPFEARTKFEARTFLMRRDF